MQGTSAIRYLLFDLDGTLINTNNLIIESFRHAFKAHGITVSDEEIFSHYGKPLRNQFEILAPDLVDELVETYRKFNWDMHDELTTGFEGIAEVLTQLERRGYQLAIVTSKIRRVVEKGLKLFDLERFFPVLICSDDTEKHKPDPEPVLKALQVLGAESYQAAMIGDSPFDLLAAKAAGVSAIAVRWSSFSIESLQACAPDAMIDQSTDLLTLFPGVTDLQSPNVL